MWRWRRKKNCRRLYSSWWKWKRRFTARSESPKTRKRSVSIAWQHMREMEKKEVLSYIQCPPFRFLSFFHLRDEKYLSTHDPRAMKSWSNEKFRFNESGKDVWLFYFTESTVGYQLRWKLGTPWISFDWEDHGILLLFLPTDQRLKIIRQGSRELKGNKDLSFNITSNVKKHELIYMINTIQKSIHFLGHTHPSPSALAQVQICMKLNS